MATFPVIGMEDPVAGGSDLTIIVVEHPSLAKVLMQDGEARFATG